MSIILTTTIAKAEGLNSNASYIKKNFPTEYENSLKKYALVEWKDDFSMVVYEINKQADAIVKLVDGFESDNTNIAFKAIQEWSRDGYTSFNINLFKEMKTFGLKDLLKMYCDWSMVKHEYDKQVKAKNSF
tara:strand:+ start:199 stop:591 length:393 start_codon:yes stop_codon:yes gene_type:complete